MLNAALILAAGCGSRARDFVADKLLAPLAGRPAFLYSVEAFRKSPEVTTIAILYRDEAQKLLLHKALASAGYSAADFRWVAGGAERQDSVLAGLRALPSDTGLVFIHDAARPLITPEIIGALAAKAAESGAACLAHRVTDTIKEVLPATSTETGSPLQTIDRSRLWAMETPQVFNRALILNAYEEIEAVGRRITDDAAALESTGHPVAILENTEPNPKLTTAGDFSYVEYLLQSRTETLQ